MSMLTFLIFTKLLIATFLNREILTFKKKVNVFKNFCKTFIFLLCLNEYTKQ